MVEPKGEIPLIMLWHELATKILMVVCFFEFMIIVELTIVQVIKCAEDEKTFSTLTIMKSKL